MSVSVTLAPELLDRARALAGAAAGATTGTAVAGAAAGAAGTGSRRLLGITGAPGAGKSTVAEALVRALGERAVLVPMDGFHLAQAELERLGRAGRKGAPDTFDAAGFVALLRRLREQRPGPDAAGRTVYAPRFDRGLEEPVAGAIPVEAHVPLVVVEGNYLLHDDGTWAEVADLLDQTWYLEVDHGVRIERLVSRHTAFGKAPDAARSWALGPDQRNADLIAAGRARATHVVAAS